MGARHTEFALGLWLAASPFVFGHGGTPLMVHDLLWGLVLTVVPLLCYVRALHRAHLLLLPLGAWLAGSGWWTTWTSEGVAAAAQNHLMIGLLLLMVAIIPSRATDRPTGWKV